MLERVALITGTASGIGMETVIRFSQDSRYQVIALDKDPLDEIFNPDRYPNVYNLRFDLRGRERIEEVVRSIPSQFGRLDVLVNAAGVMVKGDPFAHIRNRGMSGELKAMQDVNLVAPVVMMMEAAKVMKPSGGGVIVNITSAKHLFPDYYHGKYQQGKSTLSRATKGMARDFQRDFNVRLVDLQPGNTRTSIDRANWVGRESNRETETVQKVVDWWRDHFGADPKDVAEVIYQITEGKIRGTTVYTGLDTKIGRFLYVLTYPLGVLRWDYLFLPASTIFYKMATLGNVLRNSLKRHEEN